MQMKTLRNRTRAATVSLVLMFTIATALLACLPAANASDIPTYAYLSVAPNPVGVGQTVIVTMWLNLAPPTASGAAGDRWESMTVTVTKPDTTTQTLGPFDSDPVGSQWTTYVPATTGTYYFQLSFPGQRITGVGPFTGPVDNYYKPSTSPKMSLIVQQASVEPWPAAELPTDYWQRPIEAENREWSTISGNWLMSGYNASMGVVQAGAFNPYTKAPKSAHIVWTKPVMFGGLVGGEFGSKGYYTGLSYEPRFQPPVIMNGRLYYNQRLGSSSWQGLACVDLRTGEELWFKNGTTITCGQLYDYESPNQHGVIPYLWSMSGSKWSMYDAFTGDYILSLANVPPSAVNGLVGSPTVIYSPVGDMLAYILDPMSSTLTMWNSSKAIPTPGTTGPEAWEWRPPLGATLDWRNGIQWNVTVPAVPGWQMIYKISPDVIIADSGILTTQPPTAVHIGYDAKTGERLWIQNRTVQEDVSTFRGGFASMIDGVYTIFAMEKMQWYGYDAYTGNKLWGPTEPYTNAWGTYTEGGIAGYGKFYTAGYDGTVHCYDLKTGNHLWNFSTGSSGFETPYGQYSFHSGGLTLADGKLYAVTGEHSPGSPLWRGSKMYCVDAETGKELWSILGWWQSQASALVCPPAIADGYLVSLNLYDGQLYCLGKGKTATTVSIQNDVIANGSSVLIKGTVMDQSPGAKDTPAISDKDMSAWMEYLYMQKPCPTKATGVPVLLQAMRSDGTVIDIATVTSDIMGHFEYKWTPPTTDTYKILATFLGSDSYWMSSAQTALGVEPAPAAEPVEIPAYPDYTLTIIGTGLVIIVAIAAAILILRKRP